MGRKLLRGRLNRLQGAVQSIFPWQQTFMGYIQVAEEDDDKTRDLRLISSRRYMHFGSPGSLGAKQEEMQT